MKSKPTEKPLYQIIFHDLYDEIMQGNMNPNDMLPSENILAERYGTTRVTVRKSLSELERKGLIRPSQGKGYFVCAPAHDTFTFSFSEKFKHEDIIYKSIKVIRANAFLRRNLDLEEGSRVIQINRVIKRHEIPIAYDMKYLPYSRGVPLIEESINYAAFPEILAMKTRPFAFYTRMEIGAELPTKEIAEALKCEISEPMLTIQRYFINHDEECIGYGKIYYRGQYGGLKALSGYAGED